MLINKLRLKNFMSYSSKEFDFTPGSNLILGRNGVGKSSIILAIGVALFNYNQIPLQKLIKFGENQSEITVWFTHNKSSFILTRGFGKTSSIKLEYNGTIFYQSTIVYPIIREVLGITPEIFRNTMSISSSNLVSFFTLDAPIRKKLFDTLLGIDEYENTWAALRTTLSDTTKLANELQLKLNTKYVALDKLGDDKKAEIKLKLDIEQLQTYRAAILKRRDELEKLQITNRDSVQKLLKRRDELLKEINTASSTINSYTKNIEELLKSISELYLKLDLISQNICPTCKQNVVDKDLELSYKVEIEGIESKINNEELYFLNLKKIWLYYELEELKIKDDYKLLDAELKDVNQQFVDVEKRLAVLVEALKIKTNQIYNKTVLQTQYKTDKEQIEIINLKIDTVTKLREIMRNAIEYIRKNAIENINSEASIILSSLLTQNVDVIVNAEYDVDVHFDNKSLNFSQLSEGQKVMTALSIRLALLKHVSSLGLVFLDEPSINLDTTSKENLTESLYDFGFNQLFLISHDDIFENKVDNLIKV